MADPLKHRAIETREVLAAAYLGPNKGRGRMLSHAAVIDPRTGYPMDVLCRRVSVLSLADRNAQDWTLPPTCPQCIGKLRKLKVEVE